MKIFLFAFCFGISILSFSQSPPAQRNIFIITTDGFRWQEVFDKINSGYTVKKFLPVRLKTTVTRGNCFTAQL